jgi:hypothetical protein
LDLNTFGYKLNLLDIHVFVRQVRKSKGETRWGGHRLGRKMEVYLRFHLD